MYTHLTAVLSTSGPPDSSIHARLCAWLLGAEERRPGAGLDRQASWAATLGGYPSPGHCQARLEEKQGPSSAFSSVEPREALMIHLMKFAHSLLHMA